MSIQAIRRAFEKKLATLTPIDTAYENTKYTPAVGTPYQQVNLLLANPDDQVMGSAIYFEQGIFQVALHYPLGAGPSAAESRAMLIRAAFKRGTSLIESGIIVNIITTPDINQPLIDGEWYIVPISISFMAQISA